MSEKSEALPIDQHPGVQGLAQIGRNAIDRVIELEQARARDNIAFKQLRAQRDALLEKINGVLAAQRSEGGGCGGFINKPPTKEHQRRVAQAWQELHEVIKAVEEGK
jgi:hypothetical protein